MFCSLPNLPLSDVHLSHHIESTACCFLQHLVFLILQDRFFFYCFLSSFFLSAARNTSLDLGKEGLELTALLEGREIVAAANVVLSDKDVGDSALVSQLLEVGLDVGTVLLSVELNGLEDGVQLGQEVLGLDAERAVGLGEHHDGVVG